jgi:hypothetical protein
MPFKVANSKCRPANVGIADVLGKNCQYWEKIQTLRLDMNV